MTQNNAEGIKKRESHIALNNWGRAVLPNYNLSIHDSFVF